MTKDRIMQIYDAASNGIMRPEQAAILLSEVCEATLELFKIVEQQNVRIEKYQRVHSAKYVPE